MRSLNPSLYALILLALAVLQPARAEINVLIIGSTKDSGDVLSNSDSAAFDPTGITTSLRSILEGLPGESAATVNVELHDRDTLYQLANWYHHPLPADENTLQRWPMLRGETVAGGD